MKKSHRRGRVPRIRNSRSRLSLCLLLFFSITHSICLLRCVAKTTRRATTNCSENSFLWDIGWARHRTIFFTTFWYSHKLRNVALYLCVSTRHFFLLKTVVYHTLTCPDVFYDVRYDSLFEVPRACFSHSCLQRYGRSHYVYAEFVLKTFDAVIETKISPPRPTVNGKLAVLVEPRKHPLLEYTVKQVMLTLGPTWSLQIFVSSSNEDFIRSSMRVQQNHTGQNIVLTRLREFGLDDMSKYGNRVQSAFSAHEVLYTAVLSEHILWFQLDVILRSSPKDSWLQHAYIGAEWKGCEYPSCSKHTCDKVCGGGNSGLSLRRRSKLLRVATRGTLPEHVWGIELNETQKLQGYSNVANVHAHFVSDELHENSETRWFEDDLQLSYKLSKLELLPPGDLPPRFAFSQALPTEGLCRTNPSGLHKPWDTPWVSPFIVMQLLAEPFARARSNEAYT